MAYDVSSLDQQYVESLKQRNELAKQLNASLQAQVYEAQGRVGTGIDRVLETASPATSTPSVPPGQTKPVETNDVPLANTTSAKENQNVGKEKQDEKSDNEEILEKRRFRIVVNRWNNNTQKWEDSEPEPPKNDGTNNLHITYRRLMDNANERKCFDEECDIPLQGLKYLLRDNMTHVGTESFETEPIGFYSPFSDIVYNWSALEKASMPQETDENELRDARSDLKLLLDNVRISEPRKLKVYFKDRDSNFRAKTITFGTLWTLFKPGTKVLARPFMDEWQMFEVQTNWSYRNPPEMEEPDVSAGFDKFRSFNLFCAGFDWDGEHFRRYTYCFKFEKFEGRRLISGLQCFPIEYWSVENSRVELSKLKEELIERGGKFSRLCTAKKESYLCKYAGSLLQGLPPRKQRVIVDNLTFMQSRRNDLNDFIINPPLGPDTWVESIDCCPCAPCRNGPVQSWSGNEFKDPEKEREEFVKEHERLLLCPPKVLGYVPTERVWAQFSVKRLENIEQEQREKDKLCFEKTLELEKKHKDMLLALIRNHESRQNKADSSAGSDLVQDPIEGKGRGLAILLHGPPGVGKTLTAEAVALATARPLLLVSVAELGTAPNVAEDKLLDVFADASRWDAVMVIDEADVFLEERIGTTDINRNALVSVLLRVLEYYDGIIILTTNRITSLDVAVQSRMHLAIQYKDLNHGQKKSIFTKFLDCVPEDQIQDREKINRELDWICKRTDLNGRQIRNIVSAAQALAKSQRQKLSYDHLSNVYDATSDFLQSLKDLTLQKRGRNEAPR